MKITSVESFFVEVPQKPPIAPYHSRYRGQSVKKAILIRLETDSGLVGWGETPQVYLGTPLSGREAEALRPRLVGLDPTAIMSTAKMPATVKAKQKRRITMTRASLASSAWT